MTEDVSPQVAEDAQKLLDYMDSRGMDGSTGSRPPRTHIGGLIVESALQRLQKYVATVVPRANDLIQAWPEADTTSGFLERISTGRLPETVRWPEGERTEQMRATAELLADQGIETVKDLGDRFNDDTTRLQLRRSLRQIRGVGPKTTDFIEILSGSENVAAIDSRVRRATGRAGIERTGYDHLQQVLSHAAHLRGWKVGILDAVLWNNHPA